MPAFQSAALVNDVFMPLTLLRTTSGSGLDNGYRQWSEFMTEWMTRPVASDALAMASASIWSPTVCISTPSKPTARASANRSCHDSSFGSIETSTARLMLTGASACRASTSRTASSQAASGTAAVDFSTSRRVSVDIGRSYLAPAGMPTG